MLSNRLGLLQNTQSKLLFRLGVISLLFYSTLTLGAPQNSLQALALSHQQNEMFAPGSLVCRQFDAGLSGNDWVVGRITKIQSLDLQIQIVDSGRVLHEINHQLLHPGTIIQDLSQNWTPCRL